MPSPFAVPEEILTRRLRLRRHNADDVEAFQGFMANPESTRYMMFADEQKTSEGAEALLLGVAGLYDTEDPVFAMTITLLGLDRYVGSCGMSPTDEVGVMEVYFSLVPAAQGHGYATETVEALINFASANEIRRMIARVFEGNRPSVGVLERAGFQTSEVVDGEFGATSIYALDLTQRASRPSLR